MNLQRSKMSISSNWSASTKSCQKLKPKKRSFTECWMLPRQICCIFTNSILMNKYRKNLLLLRLGILNQLRLNQNFRT